MSDLYNNAPCATHDDLADWDSVMNAQGYTAVDEDNESHEESPVDLWIAKSPTARKPEVDYLQTFNPEFPVSISERGNLQKPFKAGSWTFLMELDKSFPKPTENNRLPIRVYLVMPNADEIMRKFRMNSIPNVKKDPNNSEYLVFAEMKQELQDYISGRYSEELLVEKMVKHTNDWVSSLAQSIQQRYKPTKKQTTFLSFLVMVPELALRRNYKSMDDQNILMEEAMLLEISIQDVKRLSSLIERIHKFIARPTLRFALKLVDFFWDILKKEYGML